MFSGCASLSHKLGKAGRLARSELAAPGVAWSGLFEPPSAELERPSAESLRVKVAARLGRVPRFRQRLMLSGASGKNLVLLRESCRTPDRIT